MDPCLISTQDCRIRLVFSSVLVPISPSPGSIPSPQDLQECGPLLQKNTLSLEKLTLRKISWYEVCRKCLKCLLLCPQVVIGRHQVSIHVSILSPHYMDTKISICENRCILYRSNCNCASHSQTWLQWNGAWEWKWYFPFHRTLG